MRDVRRQLCESGKKRLCICRILYVEYYTAQLELSWFR
jgi:hypothetical protein